MYFGCGRGGQAVRKHKQNGSCCPRRCWRRRGGVALCPAGPELGMRCIAALRGSGAMPNQRFPLRSLVRWLPCGKLRVSCPTSSWVHSCIHRRRLEIIRSTGYTQGVIKGGVVASSPVSDWSSAHRGVASYSDKGKMAATDEAIQHQRRVVLSARPALGTESQPGCTTAYHCVTGQCRHA